MRRNSCIFGTIIFFYIITVTCTIPNSGSSGYGNSSYGNNSNGSDGTTHNAGDKLSYSVTTINFNLIYVPAKTFKAGISDSSTSTVSTSYWIAETSATFELWNAVYTWAISNGYTFADAGVDGDGTSGESNQHPVTTINWRDAMVWTNALTEWYNSVNSTSLTTVYKSSGTPLRDSTNTALCDAVVPDTGATGFRLLTSNEWELAARYINDANNDGNITGSGEYYPGNHDSGDTTSYCFPADGGTSTVFGNYAWYIGNSGSATHPVKTALPNALGLYDMSGNVWQWCFDLSGSNRTFRGGSWNDNQNTLQIGAVYSIVPPSFSANTSGFRFAKNL